MKRNEKKRRKKNGKILRNFSDLDPFSVWSCVCV